MIRELSVVGAQILTQTKREPGTELSLSLYLEDGGEPREARAKVVRCERRPDGGVWPYLTVVEFYERLTDLEDSVKMMAEQQEKVFGPPSSKQKSTPPDS
jgi:hypothetical protein